MYRKQFELKRSFPVRVYILLVILTLLTNIAVQPYQLALGGKSFESMSWMELVQVVLLNTVIYSVLGGLGLYLATRIGLGLPFLENLYSKEERRRKFTKVLWVSVLLGIALTLIVVLVDQVVFSKLVIQEITAQGLDLGDRETYQPSWWQKLLASFYGGISEEIQLRLFLLTLFAWLGSLIWRKTDGRPGLGVLWTATVLAALVFGLGHLSTYGAMGLTVTPVLLGAALTANGIGGLVLGWLYWAYGLESAVIAHFTADIVLQLVLPGILALVA